MSTSHAKRALRVGLWVSAIILVVVAICLIQRSRELSARLVCASNLKALATCVMLYGDGTDVNMEALLRRLAASGCWGPDKTVPHCPVGDYSYRLTSAKPLVLWQNPATEIYACEPLRNHGGEGANVMFADGHTEFVEAQRFRALCKAQGIKIATE